MHLHKQIYSKKTYVVRVWRCSDYGEHWHSDVELYICLQGNLTIRIEGVDHRLCADDVLMIASNEAHEIFCDHPDTRVIIISFGYALLGNDFSHMQNASFEPPFFNLKDREVSDRLRQPLCQIRNTITDKSQDSVYADWELRGMLYTVAAYLYAHRQSAKISSERQLRAKRLEKMYGVLDYISANYRQPITLEQAAAITGYDKSYFCKQFASATGMTFHRYLNRYRVFIACQHLDDGSISICDVAERSGFTSQKKLNRIFRDALGVTPTQYRKLSAEKKREIMSV